MLTRNGWSLLPDDEASQLVPPTPGPHRKSVAIKRALFGSSGSGSNHDDSSKNDDKEGGSEERLEHAAAAVVSGTPKRVYRRAAGAE